jgi:plasmid maintenance system antidote protein VapI
MFSPVMRRPSRKSIIVVGPVLRALVRERGQDGAAAVLGVTQPFVSMLLSGRRSASLAVARRLSDATGVPLADMLPRPRVRRAAKGRAA